MYKWDKKNINNQIKYLESIKIDYQEKNDALEILKSFKIHSKKIECYTKKDDILDIKNLNEISLLNKILLKYYNIDINSTNYNKIIAATADKILLIQDLIKKVNIHCYETLLPFFNATKYIDVNKNNNNFMYYIEFLNKYYVSLSKNNNITDLTNIIHEFMHIYSTILNRNSFYKTENELLSIFSEFIILEELKEKKLFGIEPIKAQINDTSCMLEYIRELVTRKDVINNKDLDTKEYLKKEYHYNNKDIINLYSNNFNYLSSTLICYFITLELIEIYKIDKEKAIYVVENIIKSDKPLLTKLNNYKIFPLTNSDTYIRKLKKEYTIYNL